MNLKKIGFIQKTALLLLIFPLVVSFAQIDSNSPEPQINAIQAPEIAIVAPFSGDKIQGSMVIIVKPENPETVSSAVVRLLQADLNITHFEKNLSAENNWIAEWDSNTVADGNYAFEIEACYETACSKKFFEVTVENTLFQENNSEETGNSDSNAVIADENMLQTGSPEKPLQFPEEASPVQVPEEALFEIRPPNFLSLVYIRDIATLNQLYTLSGDAKIIPAGTYYANLDAFEGPAKAIILPEFLLNRNRAIAVLKQNILQEKIIIGENEFEAAESAEMDFGMREQKSIVTIENKNNAKLAKCQSWEKEQQKCIGNWEIIDSAENSISMEFLESPIAFAWLKPATSDQNGVAQEKEKFLIMPANIPASLTLFDLNENKIIEASEPVEIENGIYNALLAFENRDFSSVFFRGIEIGRNGTLLEFQDFGNAKGGIAESASNAQAPAEQKITLHAFGISSPFKMESGSVQFKQEFSGKIYACNGWDSGIKECTEWGIVSEAKISPGLNVFGAEKTQGPANETPGLIEVGAIDIEYDSKNKGQIILNNSGIQPDFSAYYKNTKIEVAKNELDLDYLPEKKGKSLLLKHKIKPKTINGTWNPSEFYFSLDTQLKDSGQYAKFGLVQQVLLTDYNPECDCNYSHLETKFNWEKLAYGETKEIIFDSENVFLGTSLLFNSAARDFSQEMNAGFKPYKISIANNIVSMWFSTDKTGLGDYLELQDLVTLSQAICNTPDNNQVWTAGNTYFLNVDGNADVSDCQLTINPCVVVKLKAGGNAFLSVVNGGVLKAQGTSANKIVFTSMNDNSVGTNAPGSSGAPVAGDYDTAIYFTTDAGVTADANDFFDLNIAYASNGIYLERAINSIHDTNFVNVSTSLYGNAIYSNFPISGIYNNTFSGNSPPPTSGIINLAGVSVSIIDFNGNTFVNNTGPCVLVSNGVIQNFNHNLFGNNSGSGTAVKFSTNTVTNFFGNVFYNNSSTATSAGVFFSSVTLTNFFDNNFSNNSSTTNGTAYFNLGTATSIYKNVFANNSTTGNGGAIYSAGGDITTVYNNLFQNNSADKNGGAISMIGQGLNTAGNASITSMHNNTFVNNSADLFGGAISNRILQAARTSRITNFYNNVFAYNTGTAVYTRNISNSSIDANFNAFWANDTNTAGYTEGSQSIYLGQTPFIDEGSDRNFLLNAYGIAQLEGHGNSATGTDSWFQGRTVRFDNRLDYNRSIGYHYDQNSPYIDIISPGVGEYSGNIQIDFNISSAGTNADATIDLNIIKNSAQDSNAFFLRQNYANWSCNASLPTTTKDANCTYVWDSTGTADGNYYVQGTAQDNNGTGKKSQANSFHILGGAADYSFVLMLPSSGCTSGKGRIDSGNGACQKGYFETTDLSGLADQNKVDPEGQTSLIPFFVYDNQSTSSSDLNITLDLNEALSGTLHLKVSKIYEGWAWACTGNTDSNCAEATTTAANIGKAVFTTESQDLNIFIWGDFNSAVPGRTDKNASSTSIAP
ncbi:MAG: hypothetical protein PHD95_04155 [Candidatus ainarchaeum sp.]|nr:hypothetical protein [Candidatus ainarchaeum sp.]